MYFSVNIFWWIEFNLITDQTGVATMTAVTVRLQDILSSS